MKCGSRKYKVLALVAVLLGGLTMVGCKHRSPEARVDMVANRIASKLDFNDQQKSLLTDIANEVKVDIASEKNYRAANKGEIEKLILATELDQARVKELLKQKHERMAAKVDKYLEKVAALHRTLTPEQRKEIIEKMDKFHSHMD